MNRKLMGLTVGVLAGAMVFGTAAGTFAAGTSLDDAKKTALEAVGLAEDEVIFKTSGEEVDDGQDIYEVEFIVPGEMKYDFDIDASTGAIIEQDWDLWEADDDLEYAALIEDAGMGSLSDVSEVLTGEITELQARMIALKDSGLKADEATFTKCKKDTDDGIVLYEIEIRTADGTEYSYDISISDGRIVEKDVDIFDD